MSREEWDASLSSCAITCFRTALSLTSCDESDLSCWCAGDNGGQLAEGIADCLNSDVDCDEGDIRRLMSAHLIVCDITRDRAASKMFISTRQRMPSTSVDKTKRDSPRPTGNLDADEGDLIAVPPPAPSKDQIPLAAKIGMAVGLSVLGLLCVILACLYIRERRRRKGLEWSTAPPSAPPMTTKKTKHSSQGSKRTTGTASAAAAGYHRSSMSGRHDSVRGMQGGRSDMRRSDSGLWRPSGSGTYVVSPSSGESSQGRESLGRVMEEPPPLGYFQELPS